MANQPVTLFDESSPEVLAVFFYSITKVTNKINRWLKRLLFRFSMWYVNWIAPDLTRAWMEENNGTLLRLHATVTWSLLAYRMYRRFSKEGGIMDCRQESGRKVRFLSESDRSTQAPEDSDFSEWKSSEIKLEYDCAYTSSESAWSKKSIEEPSKKPVEESGSTNVIARLVDSESTRIDASGEPEQDGTGNQFVNKSDTDLEDKENTNQRMAVLGEGFDPDQENDIVLPVFEKSKEDRKKLILTVKDILLFQSLEEDQLSSVVDAMRSVTVKKGKEVITEGDMGDYFYVIGEGVFQAGRYGKKGEWKGVKTYEGSGSFGELALLYDVPRALTVRALTDGKLWALDRKSFRINVSEMAYRKRKEYGHFVGSVPVLSALTEYERQQVVDALVPKTFKQGEVVVREGDAADGMFFVVEGEAKVYQDLETGELVELATLTRGEYFGELALINRQPRAATVKAGTFLKTVFLDKEAFERLLGPAVQIMKRKSQYSSFLVS